MIGSIGSSSVSTSLDKNAVALPKKAEKAAEKSVADHVAELDEQEPIRSAHATLGTMIDTYL